MALKRKRFFAAVLALAMAAGAVSARAALVTGHLDPLFGGSSPLSGDYFTGIETFTVNNSCLTTNGFVPALGCGMSFDGATINFYNEDPGIAGAVKLGTASFPSDAITFENSILGMYVQNGNVVAVQSRVTGSAQDTIDGSPYTLDIQFGRTDLTTKGGVIGENQGNTFISLANLSPANLTTLFVENDTCDGNVGGLQSHCPASDPTAAILHTYPSGSVPEPATWAMTLVGIGAIGAMLRRRRVAPAVV